MGAACCTTTKQEPIRNVQMRKPLQTLTPVKSTPKGQKRPKNDQNKKQTLAAEEKSRKPSNSPTKAKTKVEITPQTTPNDLKKQSPIKQVQEVSRTFEIEEQADSAELDENIVNLDVTINQSKEENRAKFKDNMDTSLVQKEVLSQLKMDLTLPAEPKKAIYQITNDFPVQRPYSLPAEWQKILSRHVYKQSQIINDRIPEPEEDQLMENLLNLNNRNWIRDQITLHNENMNAMQDSLDSLVRQKRAIQLREHFTWLVWAVAQFYFRPNHHVNNEPILKQETSVTLLTNQNPSETQSDYNGKSILNASMSMISGIASNPGGVSSKNNKPIISYTGMPIKLPKTNNAQWNKGFSYKGVFFKMLPFEDAEHIREEIKALRYSQIELLDLQSLQHSNEPESSPRRIKSKSQLHKEIILPLLVGIQCAGFFFYGTPLIYTQEVQPEQKSFDMNQGENSFNFNLPRMGSCVPEFNYSHFKERQSFSYLHENIDDENLKDPALELMPILKNISKKNLIPIIDFEEFNNINSSRNGKIIKQNTFAAAGSPRNKNITVNYLAVYLSTTMRSLSIESTSSTLFKIPQLNTENQQFYPFPLDKQIQYSELDQILKHPQQIGPGASLKPKGDISYSPKNMSVSIIKMQKPEEEENLKFNKKLMQKHGWRFAIIEKQLSGPNIGNENKRAVQFYSQRENFFKDSNSIPVQINDQHLNALQKINQEDRTPRKEDYPMFNQIQKQVTKQQDGKENLTSELKKKDSQVFVSPKKRSILRKNDQIVKDEAISGNCMLAGVFMKGFKLQLSLSAHTYSSGIESMFKMSLDSVAKVLNNSDRIQNINALKELLQRKGLNLRFSWILLAKVKLQHSRDLIMASILCRTMRRIVNEEIKIKVRSGKHEATKFQTVQNPTNHTVSVERIECFNSNMLTIYKEIIILYANAVMKNKFAKYKQVFDETLLGLFLSRLRIISLANSLELSVPELNYLQSKDILENVVELPSRNPILYLNSVQAYFHIQLRPEFIKQYRQDKYIILNKSQPLQYNEIKKVNMHIRTHFTLKEQAYLILARKISFNQKQKENKVRVENQKIVKAFQKPKVIGKSDASNTERHLETVRVHNKGVISKSGGFNQGKDTQRAFQNMELPLSASMTSSGSVFAPNYNNYQNIIDLSKVKKSGFIPVTSSEIFLPSVLYKLQTQVKQPNKNTVLQPFYEMPNIDVINEWVIVLESLFKDVYSAQGNEQVLIEALIYQCLLAFFIEADQDSAFKVLTRIRDLLQEALFCSPEIIVMCMTLTGMLYDANEEIELFPIESEKNYLAAMVLAFQIYGDPRGRGNYSIPYLLFFSWKLSLLALAEGKKINDSELAEELFDATLSSLFNHKRLYKGNQIEIVAAQEHATFQREINMTNLNQSQMNDTQQLKKPQNVNLQFELAMEHQELRKNMFNIKKYRKKAKRNVTKAGFARPIQHNVTNFLNLKKVSDVQLVTEIDHQQNGVTGIRDADLSRASLANRVPGSSDNAQGQLASKLSKKVGLNAHPSMQSSIQMKEKKAAEENKYVLKFNQVDQSDIEIEMLDSYRKITRQDLPEAIEDETQTMLKQINFRKEEATVGNIPFSHWSINRQICASQSQLLQNEKPVEAKRMQKEFIQDHITKSLDLDALFAWLINYNPMMVSTGVQWDSRTIKEVVFCPNQNIVNSSDSSIAFSNNKLSQYSYRSDSQPLRKKKQHLGPYSQCLSKEAGGIQKGEIMGLLYTWGTDQYGQLGLDNFVAGKQLGSMQSMKILHPRLLVPLKDELIKEICCGYAHTLAVNQYGQMYVWGNNEQGQLGLGNDDIPTVVRRPVLNNLVQNVAKVTASHEHSMALTKMQELYTWGSAMLTGLDDKENRHVPTQMEFFKHQNIVQVACGGLHTMVLTKKGILFAWGSVEGGQIGIPDLNCESISTPQKVEFLAQKSQRVVQVACGEAHTVVLTEEGKVWGWGMSMYGQLGLGFSGDSFEPGVGMSKSRVNTPTEITPYLPPDVKVAKIHCGAMFTLFITENEELYGCGINDLGQLGLDTYLEEMQVAVIERARLSAGINGIRNVVTSDVTLPSRVICFENMKVNSLTCGENHSLATIGEDKSLWAWGMFKNGQLGLGEVTFKMNPRPVQALCNTNIHRLAAGSQHSLALLGDSTQLQNLSHSFYLNSDLLNNPWGMDMKYLVPRQMKDSMNEDDY